MKPEQQRIKIAESQGWKKVIIPNSRYTCGSHACVEDTHIKWEHPDAKYSPTIHEWGIDNIPSYLRNRDAMHEVLVTMTDEEWREFFAWLYAILGDGNRQWDRYHLTDLIAFHKAPLEQVSEAYLKTKGLWEEEE